MRVCAAINEIEMEFDMFHCVVVLMWLLIVIFLQKAQFTTCSALIAILNHESGIQIDREVILCGHFLAMTSSYYVTVLWYGSII